MKISSISGSGGSLEPGLITSQQGRTLFQAVQDHFASLVKTIERIGTSIALGEKGDLEAAHQFRNQDLRKNK